MQRCLRTWLITGLSAFCLTALGQVNLMLNYSFEQPTCGGLGNNCGGSTINFWNSPTGTSPDIFDTCQPECSSCFGIPINAGGYQYPRSGIQYAGFTMGNRPFDGYEYIEGQLNKGLTGGKKYCVTYYVSLGDSTWFAVSDLGAYLSVSSVCKSGTIDTLPYIPQIKNPSTNLLSDKVNWIPISGEYTAVGGEQYITIGSFDSITPYIYIGGGGTQWSNSTPMTYYYVDDVYIQEITFAHAGRDTTICGGKVLLGADNTVAGVSYSWSPTEGVINPNAAQTYASPQTTTTYTLTVINDSMKGCRCPDSISTDVVTIDVCPENLFIPNAFSPNGDGQNDILLAKGINIETFYMAIYDRWGNEVFETYNINIGWDGTYKSQPENTGTYVYYAKGTYGDGTAFDKKGNISLVR
jgi:gliding motility-associated-like protein